MRITRLYVDGFGPFADRAITDLSPGLNVVTGPNEAGKSALRAFIRTVLFGFLSRRAGADQLATYDYPPLAGGVPGGLIEFIGEDGVPFTAERYRRAGAPVAGVATVARAGEVGGEELLQELLRHVTPQFYQNVFSLSLDELRGLDRDIQDRLASAGLGSTGAVLSTARNRLAKEIAQSHRALRDARGKFRTARGEYQQAQRELESYAALSTDALATEQRLEATANELRNLRARLARLDMLAGSREAWNQMAELQRQMSGLPRLQYLPPDTLDRLNRISEQRRKHVEQTAEGDDRQEQRNRELAGIREGAVLLEHDEDVRRLVSERAQYESAVEDIPRLEERVRAGERRLQADLAHLGPGWDVDRLGEFDTSAGARAALERHEAALDSATRAAEAAAEKEKAAVEAKEAREREASEARRAVEGFGDCPEQSADSLAARRGATAKLRALVAAAGEERRALEDTLSRVAVAARGVSEASGVLLFGQLVLSLAFAVVGAIVVVLAIRDRDGPVTRTGIVVIGTGIVGIVFAFTLLALQFNTGLAPGRLRRQKEGDAEDAGAARDLEQAAARRRERLASLESEMAPLLAELGYEEAPPFHVLDLETSRLAEDLERRRAYESLAGAAEEARVALEAAETAASAAVGERQQAHARQIGTDEQWREWLFNVGLPEDLQPRSALDVMSQIDALRARRSELDDLRFRIFQMTTTRDDIESRFNKIAGLAGMERAAPGGAGRLLNELAERRDRARETADTVARLERESELWSAERRRLAASITRLDGELKQLLEMAGARDEAHLRELLANVEKRRQLAAELDALRRASPHLTGPDAMAIDQEMRSLSHEDVLAERAEVADRIEALEHARDEMREKMGEVATRRDLLHGAPRTTELQIEINQIREEANAHAAEWAVLTLSQRLIDETIAEFRRDRQPEQLRQASAYLERFTQGRYVTVQPRIAGQGRDDGGFEIVSATGQVRRTGELSRGTVEQVYLALRFALIEEYGNRAEPMPVIMDDVLVNFDPDRARAACSAIARLAGRFQILFLTASPQTAEYVMATAADEASPAPKRIDLDFGGVVPQTT